jgi:hypothetical protein
MRLGAVAALGALSVLIGAACASVPRASLEADSGAKRFAPAEGKANLYVYRPRQFMLSAVGFDVSVDGLAFGRTAAGTYLHAQLPAPGVFILSSQSEAPAPVRLVVEPGQNYFFLQEVSFGAVEGRSFLHPMDDARGRAGVLACELVVSHQPSGAGGE